MNSKHALTVLSEMRELAVLHRDQAYKLKDDVDVHYYQERIDVIDFAIQTIRAV